MGALLLHLSWPELRHHPWRNLAALLAVMLGVALAFAVQLINQSALSEFSSAVRAVNGEADFELRGQRAGFDEALYARVARHPQVAIASPIVEIDTYGFDAAGERVPLKLIGLDALVVAGIAPALLPRPDANADRMAMLDPGALFLNPAARQRLAPGSILRVQTNSGITALAVAGSVLASGPPLAVIDIAGAQASFGWLGRLSRIDVRLAPGADKATVLRELALPDGVRAAAPDETTQRVSNVSRAYRVNLTVLALVALFTGAFLVFSILSLSVAKRQPQLALLGVLGLSARERLWLVLAESAILGALGSALGLLLGTALAALALRLLAGDLGGRSMPDGTSTQRPDDLGKAQQPQDEQSTAIAYAQQFAGADRDQDGRDDCDDCGTRFEPAVSTQYEIGEGQRLPQRCRLPGEFAALLVCLRHQQAALAYDFAQSGAHLPPRRSRSLASSSTVAWNRCGLPRTSALTRNQEIRASKVYPAASSMAARIRLVSQNAISTATPTRTAAVNARNSETIVHNSIALRRATCSSTSLPSSSMRVCAMPASVASNCFSESNIPSG